MIGTEALSRDLALYLPGLSSTLSFASLTVRAPFLSLLENHILKLDPTALRPALKAIILALLPGLEEDTSEDFERTLKLLDGFKLAIRPKRVDNVELKQSNGDEYFWQCFFLASITSNSRRLGALAYLIRNLPKLGKSLRRGSIDLDADASSTNEPDLLSSETDLVVTTPEPGLLLRCFAAGLSDEQILIQRGFLDLLVTHLPLHAKVLQSRVKQDDLELLLTAASGVVARRDMSLNRRLWSWLLGPEPATGADSPTSPGGDPTLSITSSRTRYFEQYGLEPMSSAMLKMINRDHSASTERARPFRICLSLMDRWEIGGLIVPKIFLPAMSSVERYQTQASSKADFIEVLRSASVFFDGVESGLIWGELIGLVAGAFGMGETREASEKLSLVKFIIANFNVREEEMLMVHAPTTALAVLTMLEDFSAKEIHQDATKNTIVDIPKLAMTILTDLIELIPERALLSNASTNRPSAQNHQARVYDLDNSEILDKIHSFYVQDQGNLDSSPPPFSERNVCDLLVRKTGSIMSQSLTTATSSADVAAKTKLFITLINKSPKTESLDVRTLLSSVQATSSTQAQLPFCIFTSMISLVTTLYPLSYISTDELSGMVEPLVCLAWSHLSTSFPKYHVESVRAMWQLQTCLSFSNHEIEAAICKIIAEHDTSVTLSSHDTAPGRSFCVLWTHTLQDNSGNLDRRGSKSSKSDSKLLTRVSGVRPYEIMLARPLFLLLDALLDERTQLFVTIRTWLQSLIGVDK
jgi:hypothetical protein